MRKLFIRNIKKGFATNSSSYHSTLIMTDDEYKKWISDQEVVIDGWTSDEWYQEGEFENEYSETEYDEDSYTTPDGLKIRFLCRYGANY